MASLGSVCSGCPLRDTVFFLSGHGSRCRAMSLDKLEKRPREIHPPAIQKDLLVHEEQEGSVNFNSAVLYAKDGQLTDD
ncbi:GTPase-activating Rap/Ran-GAP domain-like protein 3 [Melospiza melodia melodia]|uniref:GTPase-activating Rap/Ran-GAP domain-like protein 3 n=1 Tax=Melospiza melodia melodia TaxID=1914991 RepID=UPI002FD73E11